jgi:hypothetical protein
VRSSAVVVGSGVLQGLHGLGEWRIGHGVFGFGELQVKALQRLRSLPAMMES